ncbi:His Kinase A (phosphoacceptor) domain, partial [Rhizoctonia solani]
MQARMSSSVGVRRTGGPSCFSVTTILLPVAITPQSSLAAQVYFNPRGQRGQFEDRIEFVFKDQGGTFVITRPVRAIAGTDDLVALAPIAPYQRARRARERDIYQEIINIERDDAIVPQVTYKRRLKVEGIPEDMRALLGRGRIENQIQAFKERYLPEILDIDTFQQHWSNLVHAEHIQAEIDLKEFDMDDITLQRTNNSYRLTVPGLSEKRPSVIVGDRIKLHPHSEPEKVWYMGIVREIETTTVLVAFNRRFPHAPGALYDVQFVLNPVPFQRMIQALNVTPKRLEILFPQVEDVTASSIAVQNLEEPEIELYNHIISSNYEQYNAVSKVVGLPPGSPPFIVFGPPGTGKTVTIVECISQLLNDENVRVLACAPSNSASDLLAQRLIYLRGLQTNELLRLNALWRPRVTLPEDLVEYSLINATGNSFRAPTLEQLGPYRVIVTTCSTAALFHGLGADPGYFTHIFIDEAGQGSEPEVMIPILTMSGPDTNVVLSGDPKQLGPVIRSPVARTLEMNISYLDRLMESPTYDEVTMRGISVVKLLQNFRSHERIISFPNEEFYRNELVAHAPASVADSLLSWNGLASPDFPVVFEAVRGEDMQEEKSPSYFNPHEASLVKEYVQGLLPFIASSRNIGIVTPYKAQVRKIRKLLKDNDIADIDIGSVEQFQGQERQVIIVSTVRSNKDLLSFDLKHTLGFVSNPKRLNVAITRAQSLLVVIGDPLVLGLDALWRRFMYFVYRSGGWKGAPFPWSPDADPDDDPATFDAAERDLRDLLRRATEVGSPKFEIGRGNDCTRQARKIQVTYALFKFGLFPHDIDLHLSQLYPIKALSLKKTNSKDVLLREPDFWNSVSGPTSTTISGSMLASRDLLRHVPLISFLDAYPEPAFILCTNTLPHSSLEFMYGNHALHSILFGHDDTAVLDDQGFFSALISDQDVFWLGDPFGSRSPITPHPSRTVAGDSRKITIRPDWLPRDHTPLDLELTPTPIDLPVIIPGVGSTTHSYVFIASPRRAPMNLLRSEAHTELQLRRDPGLRLSDFPPLPSSSGTRIRSRQSKSESTSWVSQPIPYVGVADLPSRMIETFPWEKTSLGPRESWPMTLKLMIQYLMEKPIPVPQSCIFWSWPDQVMIYNDTYAKMIGSKHPGSFGQVGRIAWGELWDMLIPVSEQCRRGKSTRKNDGGFALVVPVSHPSDLCARPIIFQFADRTPPTRRGISEDGTIGGVWNSTLETTQKVIAERRLSGISELSARMSDARTQEQFGERTMEVLSRNPIDLPFVALYWCEVENVSAIAAPVKYGAPALASTYLRHHTETPTNVKLTLTSSLGIPDGHPIARQVIKYTLDPVTYRPIQVLSEPDNIESPATVTEATPRLSMFGSPMGSVSSTIHLPPTSPTKGMELGIDLSKIFASGTVELIDPLPSQLAQGLDGRGFKDIPRAAALLPINMYSQNRSRHNGRLLPYAVLLVGLNTRRPYDADYASWLEGMAANLSNQLTVVLQREADMKLIEEQERIDKAKTMFFTNVSHELRTPLTLIQAPLEQLAVSEGVSRDLHYKIHLAMRNCKRLKKLVDSIMDMSKLEAGKLVGSFRPVQLGRITADLAALFRSMAEKKGIEYQISCDMEDEPAVYVDLDLWEKIVCNLLSNAFKYTSKGRVGLSVTHDTLFSYVRVSDTGVGIPREHIDAVFERFFRAAEGTGVGLSLTKELVSLHRGHMSLSSQTEQEAPGESGSIFTVTLPHGCVHLPAALIHEGASDMNGISRREMEYWMEFEQPTPSSNASASDEAESATSSTLFFEKEDVVLVVDDNADMRAYIRKIFSPYLTVTEARNGIEALKVAMSQKINLILCDVMMPGMDGPEMLRRLRGERKTRLLPVIFVTASDDANLFGGQADGVVDCISKPFRVRDMLARVHLQLQLGKRRVRLEEDFEVRSHELQVLTDLSPVGIFRVDTNGKLMYVNPAWHQITGFPQERDRDEWIDHSVHPSSKSEMIRIWRACFEQEKSSSMRIQWNSNCWTHVAISPLVSPDGAMLGAFGAITDINEQHRAEEARIALAEEREHIAASKAEDAEAQRQLEVHLELLIDVTSHELRYYTKRRKTAMKHKVQVTEINKQEVVRTNMKGLRDLLHDCKKRNMCYAPTDRMLAELEDDLQAMDSITQCGLAQARIANDVLSLSRIQLNVLSIIPTEFDIKQETSQILMVFRNELMSKDIGFELDLGRGIDIYGLQTISTDRSRYAQIITNLMSNAIRFTDMSTGSRHIKVALELSLDPPSDESCAPPPLRTGRSLSHSSMDFESNDLPVYVYVSVQDSGPGLQKEDLALLFQRFQQGSVSSSIRDLMGGRIEVVSHIGEGAIFRFFIKAAAAAGRIPRPPRPIGIRAKRSSSVQSKGSAVSKSSARSGHRPLPETPNLQNNRPLHVLITEDNKINQTVLARQMKRAGFTYALASNGLEAIQAIDKVDSQTEIPNDLSTRKFDVMDLEMPVLDGFAATREIRRREAVHSLKTRSFIIALTGNARREQVQSARDAGVDDVMIKVR